MPVMQILKKNTMNADWRRGFLVSSDYKGPNKRYEKSFQVEMLLGKIMLCALVAIS
jgi:hypothetical protein